MESDTIKQGMVVVVRGGKVKGSLNTDKDCRLHHA
jgi:hypothetical protein